jgi:hypothetical protein
MRIKLHEHTEHQMYLIAYLEKDEDEVLKLASDRSLLNKRERNKKVLLDVLKEKRLIAVLDSKVADRMASYHADFSSARIQTAGLRCTLTDVPRNRARPAHGPLFADYHALFDCGRAQRGRKRRLP